MALLTVSYNFILKLLILLLFYKLLYYKIIKQLKRIIMNSIEIRKATSSDVELLLPMLELFGFPTEHHILKDHLKKFTSENGNGVVVAIYKDAIVGFIAWSKSLLFVSKAVRFRIEGLYVDEKYRRLKIGKKLLEHVEEVAKSCSPAIMDLICGKRREKEGAHEFYKSLGYKKEGDIEKVYFRKEFSI